MSSLRTSFQSLFVSDRRRQERLDALSQVLDHGNEDDYLQLLVGWGVPSENLGGLVNEFRRYRREKRAILQ